MRSWTLMPACLAASRNAVASRSRAGLLPGTNISSSQPLGIPASASNFFAPAMSAPPIGTSLRKYGRNGEIGRNLRPARSRRSASPRSARAVIDKFERPGGDRVGGQRVERAFTDDRRLVSGDSGRQVGIGDRQIEPGGQRIDCLDAVDHAEIDPQDTTNLLVEDPLES